MYSEAGKEKKNERGLGDDGFIILIRIVDDDDINDDDSITDADAP